MSNDTLGRPIREEAQDTLFDLEPDWRAHTWYDNNRLAGGVVTCHRKLRNLM